MEQSKLAKFNKIFPWYGGLSADLLFWVAIDTLFLTAVKNFNAAQIVSLTTVSLVTCIALQIPILKIIKKNRKYEVCKIRFTFIINSKYIINFWT